MTEILHLWALAPAAVGACCLAADRRRVRMPELAASTVMLLAMLDMATMRLVAPVFGAAALLTTAMALAAVRSARRRGRAHRADAMTLHTGLGIVVMAVLLLVPHAGTAASGGGHAHGGDPAALTASVALAALVYAGWSGVAAIRRHPPLDRVQYAAMGASVLAMILAVGVG
ncbi:hypothetical protein [Microbacterium sp. GXF7504]